MSDKWYKLDNAALIYAPSANGKWSCVFRVACVMKEKVNAEVLQHALDDIMPRFPTFAVRLRAGAFWYYFDRDKTRFTVEEESGSPCAYLNIRECKHLLRVLYYNHRIAVEIFHGVADGGGGMIFLKTLVRRYLELSGIEIEGYEGCFNYLDKPAVEEIEDSYRAVADMKEFGTRLSPIAYKVKNPFMRNEKYVLTHFEMKTDELRAAADRYECSVGHLIAAVIMYGIYRVKERERTLREAKKRKWRKNLARPIVLCASIDLRRRFKGHNSIRNFSHYINIVLADGKHSFAEVVECVKSYFSKITDQYVMASVNSNVKDSVRKLVRFMPLFLKVIGFSIAYEVFGEPLNSVSMSNYGVTPTPEAFKDHIERFETAIGVAKVQRNLDTSVVSFNGKTVMTFCSMGIETEVEKNCAIVLTKLGVQVTVDGNRREYE